MTKEQRNALDALINWFSPDPCPDDAAHEALEALRDSELDRELCGPTPKPAQDPERVTSREIRRLEQELGEWKVSNNGLSGLVKTWRDWAESFCPDMSPMDARREISRLVELGREAEGALDGLLVTRAAIIDEWKVANGYDDLLDAYCDAVRGRANAEAELRQLTPFPCDNKPLTVKPELAGCEPPRDALGGLKAAPPWKGPEVERCPRCGSKKGAPLYVATTHGQPYPCDNAFHDEPQPTELEAMLEALMGPACEGDRVWSWANGYLQLSDDRAVHNVTVRTPTEALQAINARLAELAPKLSICLYLTVSGDYMLQYWRKGEYPGGEVKHKVRGDLGARTDEALSWIAAQEKPEVKAPIEPPVGYAEQRDRYQVTWECDAIWVCMTAKGYLTVNSSSGEVPDWLPQLRARVKQVFGKEQGE